MTPQEQFAALQAENAQLRQELERIHAKAEAAAQMRRNVAVGGARLLVPLLDREHVVRSFSALAQTTARYSGPREQWPPQDEILGHARTFMEACVRFVIRRRTILLLFSLLASSIPIIQLWVVKQQNEIIENQNKFFEIQVYDVVSRSMTEGDRNARLMTGALLSNADLDFLGGVVDEAFDLDFSGVYHAEGVNAATRRLEDAAFRGYLIRAVVRGVENRAASDTEDLYAKMQPMLHRILVDAGDRMPEVMRHGEKDVDDALAEQVDNYVVQVGGALRIYGRLARSEGETEAFHADVAVALSRLADRPWAGRFGLATRFSIERFLFEVAHEAKLGDPPPSWNDADESPDRARADAIEKLKAAVGTDSVKWDRLAAQVEEE